MPLENADRAIIDPEKLLGYLLSETHPVGRYKAAFFFSLGYSADEWRILEGDLRRHVANEAGPARETPFGRKYQVRASIKGPNGRSAQLVTFWIILSREDFPRFITAYPGTKS